MKSCIIALSSVTYAIKAQKLLSQSSIRSRVIKLDSKLTKRGCAYGIETDCRTIDEAVNLISSYGLPYSEVVKPV